MIALVAFVSPSLKSQYIQSINDTNITFYDYIPDITLFDDTSSLTIDMNQDNIPDISFFYDKPLSGGRYPYIKNTNNNVNFSYFNSTNTDTLNNPSIIWRSGNCFYATTETDDYWGVKFINGSDLYYGWIHLTPLNLNIVVDKYAFCKIRNYPFKLGQTTLTTHIPDINNQDCTTISLTNSKIIIHSEKTIYSVSFLNITGVILASQNNINLNNTSINVSNLAHGSYIIKVQFINKTIFSKLITL